MSAILAINTSGKMWRYQQNFDYIENIFTGIAMDWCTLIISPTDDCQANFDGNICKHNIFEWVFSPKDLYKDPFASAEIRVATEFALRAKNQNHCTTFLHAFFERATW